MINQNAIITFIAAVVIPAGARVKLVSGSAIRVELAGASDNEIGTAILHSGKSSYAVDTEVGVHLVNAPGTRHVLADAGDITAGELIYRAADGKVADTGSDAFGYALEASAAANDVINALYSPSLADQTVADGSVTATKIGSDAVVTAKILDANVTPAKTNIVQARTATADGLTTGIISDTATFVAVTSADANHIVVLPTPTPGREVTINVGATGFELRSSTPASVAINGGTGASAESAIPANSTVIAKCITATAWKAIFLDADSDVAKVEAAA